MADLASRQLEPHGVNRDDLLGPSVVLTPVAAQNIGLALHELATNAVRCGALSLPPGRVWFTWNLSDGDAPLLRMFWREEHGPLVALPARQGFGTVVLTRIAPVAMDGTAQLSFDPDGVRYWLQVPAAKALKNAHQPPLA